VRTFCTSSRRPAGPLAPPTRRARLRSRYSGANAGRLARKIMKPGPPDMQKFHLCRRDALLPLPGLSGAGQNLSRPSVTAGQPHPPNCLVNVHAKTTLTEPARTRSRQLSEAGTRMARACVWHLCRAAHRQPASQDLNVTAAFGTFVYGPKRPSCRKNHTTGVTISGLQEWPGRD